MARSLAAIKASFSGLPAKNALLAAHIVHRLIGTFERGQLALELPSGHRVVLHGRQPGREAHVVVLRWRALRRIALKGDLGFAECLSDGDCASRDVKSLLLWAIENTTKSTTIAQGLSTVHLLSRLRHGARANTRRNSRRNIAAHYDLGNAFYKAWLDADLNYSSGLYLASDFTLAEAQKAKARRVAALMELRGSERVLEIGCGWGALARHLITCHQSHVTGLTLSARQRDHARRYLSGLEGFADIRLQDYRDVDGTFDRIVSIEMLEAVGEAYWPVYFEKLEALLAHDGLAVLQVITIDESRYESYRHRPDFIQLSIFPGGMLPTKRIIGEQATRANLELTQMEFFGSSYMRTLATWRERFNAAWPRIAELGFDERFRRLWDYYLVYCEAGFEAGWLDVGLYQLRHAR
jgi:cyclopropane-fatty-acyl-phospholipid synthase